MVTYKNATQVVRNECVNQQAKKVKSRAIFLLVAVRDQSVRRQHKKRTSKKSDMVTYKNTTQVTRNRSVPFFLIWQLGRMGHNMSKWLVIFLLNNLAMYFWKGELRIYYFLYRKCNFLRGIVCHLIENGIPNWKVWFSKVDSCPFMENVIPLWKL